MSIKEGDIVYVLYSIASHQLGDNVALNHHSTDSSHQRTAIYWTAERYKFSIFSIFQMSTCSVKKKKKTERKKRKKKIFGSIFADTDIYATGSADKIGNTIYRSGSTIYLNILRFMNEDH